MPIVKVNMLKGKSNEYKKNLLDSIHEALIESLNIEDYDRFQRILEYDKLDFEYPNFKTDNFMIIELTLFPGRTKEQKKKAIEVITDKICKSLNIEKTDVFIIINDPPLENFGMGGNQKG